MGPAWYTVSASAGKSARGMPKVIARMSITKLPISSPLLHANRSPARTGLQYRLVLGDFGGRLGLQHRRGDEHRDERGCVQRVGKRQSGLGDDDPASAGPTTMLTW